MQNLNYKNQKNLILVTFLFLPLAFLLIFTFYPALKLLELSFAQWDGMSPNYGYAGISNYIDVFKDVAVLKTFENNMAYVIISIIQTFLALYLSIILNGKLYAKNFFKSIIFMPYILNGVAVVFMFTYFYDFERGPINLLLKAIGLGGLSIRWLSESYFSNFSLAMIGLWRYTGFAMVIFLGALQSIPGDIYEAADIDGTNFFQKIRYITIPSIKNVIELNLILSINGALQAYFEAFIVTKGGPAGRTDTFVTSTLNIAFTYQNFGKASAMGIILLITVIAIVVMQRKILNIKDE